MSKDLPYFPPKGTRFQWGSKALNHSPWVCNILSNLEDTSKYSVFPVSIHAYVDLNPDFASHGVVVGSRTRYVWRVRIYDWRGTVIEHLGGADTDIDACKAAETCGIDHYRLLFPDWVKKSLSEGWRPPGRAALNH